MNLYKNLRFFQTIILIIITIALLIVSNFIRAAEINVTQEKIVSGDNYGNLSDQGKLRTYYLYIPKSYHPERPMPLVLVFHGDDDSGKSKSRNLFVHKL